MTFFIKKRDSKIAFWALDACEAFATLIVFLLIPSDPRHAVFAGFSFQRLMLFAAGLLLSTLFLGLTWTCAKEYPLYRKIITRLNTNTRGLGWLGVSCLLAGLASGWLLIITPPQLSAIVERLQPYLILVILIAFQGLTAFWVLHRSRFKAALIALRQDITSARFQVVVGWALLLSSFLVGLITLYFTYYNLGDEGDNLTAGWLISKGWVLYRDIFSHHFPFPYLWVGLVMRIFGPSILAARLSLVVLRTLCFAIAMKLSGWRLPGGLTAFAWSLIGPLYLGNMLLYDAFGGLFLIPAILVTLAYLMGKVEVRWQGLAFIGGMTALACLSDPVTASPGFLLLMALLCSGVRDYGTGEKRVWKGIARAGTAGFSMGAVILLFSLVLKFSGASFGEFLHQAIWFNQSVYSHYARIPKLADFVRNALMGLGLFNPLWRENTALYYQWSSFSYLDHWIFTGLFFRLAIIILSLYYLLRRRWLEGIFIYLLASFLTWRASAGFHAQGFILFSLMCAALLTSGGLGLPVRRGRLPVRALSVILLFPVGVMFLWLTTRSAQFMVEHRADLRFEAAFGTVEESSKYYQSATCNLPDASILLYPSRTVDYLISGIPPASRYLFMFPWVADVGQTKVINELRLKKDEPVMVLIDQDANIWGHPVKDYLHDLIQALDKDYISAGDNVYISPGLAADCTNKANKK